MMQMSRTFHQAGVAGHEREVTVAADYPGTPVRYATLVPMIFNPNPLQPNTKIQYTTTTA